MVNLARDTQLLKDVAGMTLGTAAATTSTVLMFEPRFSPQISPLMLWKEDESRRERYFSKLSKMDPELGKTYRSVWEAFYSMTSAPEKNALYAMRQSFDHFFSILAPDQEVRLSKCFVPKTAEKDPNKVYRSERIKYAADTKIADKNLAAVLLAKASHMLELYEELNKMHTREGLQREVIKSVLTAMQCILEEWIDAVSI